MTRPEIELPDDVETLKAMVLAMAEKAARVEALEKQVDDLEARNADADERIERLTQILKAFDRARFGRRSEKLAATSVDDEQHAFVFEEIETGIAAISAKVTSGINKDGKRPPRPRKFRWTDNVQSRWTSQVQLRVQPWMTGGNGRGRRGGVVELLFPRSRRSIPRIAAVPRFGAAGALRKQESHSSRTNRTLKLAAPDPVRVDCCENRWSETQITPIGTLGDSKGGLYGKSLAADAKLL